MRKLLTILFSFFTIVSLAQNSSVPTPPLPNWNYVGSPTYLTDTRGVHRVAYGFIHARYADTATANTNAYIKSYPGLVIVVGDTVYMRNSTATQWLVTNGSGGGGGSGTVINVATGFGLLGGPVTTTGTIEADTTLLGTKQWVYNILDSLPDPGIGGISKVVAGYGLANNNDSTLRVDSTVIANKDYVDNAIAAAVPNLIVDSLGATGVDIVVPRNNTLYGRLLKGDDGIRVDTLPDGGAVIGWRPRTDSTASSATPAINTNNVDIFKITALAADITSMTTNLSGTPFDGQILELQITGTATRNITWGASFASSTVTLPAATDGTNTLTVILQYYTTTSYGNHKWICVNYF